MTTLVDLSFKANTSDLDKAQASLDATQKKTKELNSALDSFMASVSKASGAMLDFEKSSSKVSSSLKDVAASFNPVKLAVGALTAAIAGFTLGGLKSMVSGVIDGAAELNNLSTKTGLSVEQLSIMKSVAAQSGTSMDTVTGAVLKFEKAIASSSNATSIQAKAFKELGINTSDTSKTTEDYMSMAAEKLSGLEDGWQKNNIVMALFGKTGTDVNEFLADYANRGDLAAKVTKQEAEEAEQYERNMKKLSATANQYKTLLGMGLLPVLSNISDELLKSVSASGKLDAETKKLIKNEVTEWAFGFAKGIGAAIDVGIAFFNLLKGLGTAIGTFGGAVSTAFGLLSDLLSGKLSISDYLARAKDNALQFGQGMKSAWNIAMADSSKYYDLVNRAEANYRSNLGKTISETKGKRTPGNIGDADANKSGSSKVSEAEKETDALKRYAEELQKRLATENQLTTEVTARQLIERQYPQATKEIKEQALALAKQVDELERKNIVQKQSNAIADVGKSATKRIEDEIKARKLSIAEIERERVAEQLEQKVQESLTALSQKGLRTLEAEVELRQQATKALNDYDAAVERKKISDQDWLTNGAKQYTDSFKDLNGQLSDIASNGFKGMEDGLVSLATTGKMNFKDFAASMISDILRMIIQMTVMKSLMSAIGFGNGGAFSGGSTVTPQALGGVWNGGVQAYADGGLVNSPTFFGMAGGKLGLMGEAGPEAIMPLRRGPDGKLGVTAAGSSTTVYSPTIQISVGTVDSTDRISEMETKLTQAMESVANRTIAKQARKGGLLNPVR